MSLVNERCFRLDLFAGFSVDSITQITNKICEFLANVNICYRPSVCLSSVTLVHPTQAIEIFGNVSTPFGSLAICEISTKSLRRSFQGNPVVGD